MLADKQSGCIPAAYGHQVCKRRTTANETTSKSRTAAASPALVFENRDNHRNKRI